MLSTSILVVDDDADLALLVGTALEREGYTVTRATSAIQAFDVLARTPPDLVIIDLLMPVIGGLEVLEHLRRSSTTPVIIVSALADEECRVRGFRLGADDYVVKPFSVRELVARVGAVLRRSNLERPASVIEHQDLVIRLTEREVWAYGKPVETTAKEFDLLAFLAAHPGRVFTRHELLRDVWGSSAEWQQEGTVTEHIRRLRLKIEQEPDRPHFLQTVRGVGYRFNRRRADRAEPAAASSGTAA
jgi:two-component system, OmpR family, phosphate regulon response regulator PhoB